jgi:phosphoglycolate phosphatase-like HAD superfamily hydrolase
VAVLILPDREVEIDTVGLDVDGVVRETGYLAFHHCRLAITELGGIPPELDDFVHDWGGLLNTYFRSCGVTASDEEIRRVNGKYTSTHDIADPYHDVEDALTHLESLGVHTFALSGHGHPELKAWFEKHGLYDRFGHVQGNGGAKVEQLVTLRHTFSVLPARACYIGDWGQDMRAARAANFIPIGITRDLKTRHVLERNEAAIVIDHLHELATLIR